MFTFTFLVYSIGSLLNLLLGMKIQRRIGETNIAENLDLLWTKCTFVIPIKEKEIVERGGERKQGKTPKEKRESVES